MALVKTNVVLRAPIVGLSLTKLKTAIDLTIKDHVGPLSNLYYFESNVVIEIPTSCQPVRVFPSDSQDTSSKSEVTEVALYTLVDISYDWCSGRVSDTDKPIFYETVPGAIQQTVQASIKDTLCSGIRVGIGSIKFARDAYCKNMAEPVLVPLLFNDLDNRIRFHMEKHLDTLLPLLRSKL